MALLKQRMSGWMYELERRPSSYIRLATPRTCFRVDEIMNNPCIILNPGLDIGYAARLLVNVGIYQAHGTEAVSRRNGSPN